MRKCGPCSGASRNTHGTATASPANCWKPIAANITAKAAPVVLELMNRIDANSRKLRRIVYGGFSATHEIMTRELIEDGRDKLAKAIASASGKEKVRLERFRDTWEMFAQAGEVYRLYCVALNERTPESLAAFQKALAACETYWKEHHLAETCSPRVLARLKDLDPASASVEPAGRSELADKTVWKDELFASDDVPATLTNLTPLPEVWKFRIDADDIGLKEKWEEADYKDSGWRDISTWQPFEKQGNKGVDGRFWYRVKFQAPKFPDGKRIFLRFGSVDDEGDIYINGQLAHSRHHLLPDDWKTSFEFDATDFIRPGAENVIAVRGYDSTGAGGIWRPVALYTK